MWWWTEALQVSNSFEVRSHVRTYRVSFTDDWMDTCTDLAEDERTFFVVDAAIAKKFGSRVERCVPSERMETIEATEAVKTLEGAGRLVERLSERGVRRHDMIVAIGGGVIQDVVGFTASILYRGVEWTFLPTTLLAQADSCIGGKTSINVGTRKNLVGTFYPPGMIYIDPGFLESLPEVEIRSGIGEIMHYYVYAGSPLLEPMVEEYSTFLENPRDLCRHIREALHIKRGVIEIDEFDKGERNKFNYGHTFGHALESISEFELRHGQAVTAGMCLANDLSVRLGLLDAGKAARLNALLSVNLPSYEWGSLDFDRYFELLSRDKKNVGKGTLTCILAEGYGRLVKQTLPMDDQFAGWVKSFFLEEIHRLK